MPHHHHPFICTFPSNRFQNATHGHITSIYLEETNLLAASVPIPPLGEETTLLGLLGVAGPPGSGTGVLRVALLAGQTLEQRRGPVAAGASSAGRTGASVGAAARGAGGHVRRRGALHMRARAVSQESHAQGMDGHMRTPKRWQKARHTRLSFMSRPTDDEVVAVAVAGMAEADGRRYAVGGPPRTQTLVCS